MISLQKNIIEMFIFSCYIYCVSTPFILVFIIIFNIFIFNHFDPKKYGIISCLFTMDTTVSVGKYALFLEKHRNDHTVTVFTITFHVHTVTLMRNRLDIFKFIC